MNVGFFWLQKLSIGFTSMFHIFSQLVCIKLPVRKFFPPFLNFPKIPFLQIFHINFFAKSLKPPKLEDCALQLYRYDGTSYEYGSYLDLDSPLDEQMEELEGFDGRFVFQ